MMPQENQQPIPPQSTPSEPPSVLVAPQVAQASPPPQKPNNKKKIIATIFTIALVLSVGTAVTLVGQQQLSSTQAWDCSKYVFEVSKDGVVTVRNGSTRNESAQKAEVLINNVLVKTFDVPALSAGQASTLGTVTVPTSSGFTWVVDGTTDCKNSGQYDATQSTPTPGQISAACSAIKVYDNNWNQIAMADLSKLKAGDVVRFTVSGSASSGTFDRARFTVNGTQRPEVITKKAGTEEYYDEYTIPAGITNFQVTAQIKHSALGWF